MKTRLGEWMPAPSLKPPVTEAASDLPAFQSRPGALLIPFQSP